MAALGLAKAWRGLSQTGWWLARVGRLLVQAGTRLAFNGGHVSAAAISYYALLSLFPLLLLLLSVLGFVIPDTTLADRLVRFGVEYLPGAGDFFRESLNQLIAHRGSLGLVALVTLYWSASGAFVTLSRTLDLVWDTPVTIDRSIAFRGPPRAHWTVGIGRRLRALLVVGGVAILLAASVFATTYLRLTERLGSLPRLGPFGPDTGRLLLGLAGGLSTAVVFLLIYALIPRRPPSWRALWPGTLAATALFESAKSGFTWYATKLQSYEWVYGSITTTIVLLIWFYLVALIVIYGAEVSAMASVGAAPESGAPAIGI